MSDTTTTTSTSASSACGCMPIAPTTCTPMCYDGPCTEGPWSMYDISDYNPEHRLMASHLCEVADVTGFKIQYRILLTNEEYLWGEDANEQLSEPVETRCIYDPTSNETMLDMMGMSSDENIQFMSIPIATFERDLAKLYYDTFATTDDQHVVVQPKPGDVITTTWNGRNYEITHMEPYNTIFMAKGFTYDLVLKPFRYSSQSDSHKEVFSGETDFFDPFASIIEGPDGNDYLEEGLPSNKFGDNIDSETESDKVYDYSKENDPDFYAFKK